MLYRDYTPKDDDNLTVDLHRFDVGELNSADVGPGAAEIRMATRQTDKQTAALYR